MRILHINTLDIEGGAARATLKLHKQLLRQNVNSTLLVLVKKGYDNDILNIERKNISLYEKFRRFFLRLYLWMVANLYKHTNQGVFSDDRSCHHQKRIFLHAEKYDLLNLHWISGFIDYRQFFKYMSSEKKPIVWRLADMNAFTGGCHYDFNCNKYSAGCGACPQLNSNNNNDLSSRIWKRKNTLFSMLNPEAIHLVALSSWMKEKVNKSPFFSKFPITLIPNGVNLNIFQPKDKKKIREALNISSHKKVILCIAHSLSSPRKGLSYAIEAINTLDNIHDYVVITVGYLDKRISFKCPHFHFAWTSNNDELARYYNAADVFLFSSIEENFPNTVIESMACGTPAVGFAIGGVLDIIEDNVNGLLVEDVDSKKMSEQIVRIFSDRDHLREMQKNGLEKCKKNYDLDIQTKKYADLYKNILKQY
jgi:glycosyltransferase involved in cell wall biosynthesis